MIAGPYAFLNSVFVAYDVNSGNISTCSGTKTVVFNQKYGRNALDEEEKLCIPTKTGYDFNWWMYRDTTNKVTDDTTVYDKTDHVLKAKWTPHVYTVTLDKNSATNTPTTSIKITYDSPTIDPTSITVPQRVYTVSGFGIDSSRKSNGAEVSSTSNLTSTYSFDGWTATKDGSTAVINNSNTPALIANVTNYTDASSNWKHASNVTLYAKWTSASVTLPTITKTGYEYGWTTSATGTSISYAPGATYTPTSTLSMYGVCKACTYTVVFNKNSSSATGTTASQSCTYDAACTLRSSGFSKSGYTFAGWKLNNSGSTLAAGASVRNATSTNGGTVTYYAQWVATCTSTNYSGCRWVSTCRLGATSIFKTLANALATTSSHGYVCNSYSAQYNLYCGPTGTYTKMYVIDDSHAYDKTTWGAIYVCFLRGDANASCNNCDTRASGYDCAWIQSNCLTQYYAPDAIESDNKCYTICSG